MDNNRHPMKFCYCPTCQKLLEKDTDCKEAVRFCDNCKSWIVFYDANGKVIAQKIIDPLTE